MQSRRSINQVSISNENDEQMISQQNQSHSHQIKQTNQNQFFDDIDVKFQKLKKFIESIQQSKDRQISSLMLQYFGKSSLEFQNIKSDVIIKQTQKRIEKMIKSKKSKKNWSSNDMNVLIWVICKLAQKQNLNLTHIHNEDQFWNLVSSVIPGTTPKTCLFKWLSERRYKITQFNWKQSEEKFLMELQEKYRTVKNKWKVISEELYLKNQLQDKVFRHPKQCREHYASFLDPTIKKGPWSKQQDIILLQYIVFRKGEKKWCKLTKILQGRTQNAIKNRYQLLCEKLRRKKQNKSKSELIIMTQYLRQNDPEFEIKRTRFKAAENQKEQKNSVEVKQAIPTCQALQGVQMIGQKCQKRQKGKKCQQGQKPASNNISPAQKNVKIVTPIIIRHSSNFRIYENSQLDRSQLILLKQNLFEDSPSDRLNRQKQQ